MSKFNTAASAPTTKTYEGAKAYEKELEQDWMNILFSSFLENGYYEDAQTMGNRFLELTDKMAAKYGYRFIAKAAQFSRNELGMRSISQLAMSYLNSKSYEGKRQDFTNYFHRPDDVSEIFAAIESAGEKRSHALVRGAADYLSTCDEYQLAKYSMCGKKFNMFDLINITHAHSAAIDAYKAGRITSPDTWEHNIMVAPDQESREEAWRQLVENNKMGYLALLRNLRNILDCNFATVSWIEKYLVPQLTNEYKIKKSLVFPYQIYLAYKNLVAPHYSVVAALDKAFRISTSNVPNLDGDNLIILDVSGSMNSYVSFQSSVTIKELGAVYAAMILFANPKTDFIKFASKFKKCSYKTNTNVFAVIDMMQREDNLGCGTSIIPVLDSLDKSYDRMFLISDMQVMDGYGYGYGYGGRIPASYVNQYMQKSGKTHIYSFDLGNYKSQIMNPNAKNLTLLTTLNETVFKMLEFLEKGGKSLVDYISETY